jgi:nicotinate-nucleotide pyrophosphorylase (carboxylating)
MNLLSQRMIEDELKRYFQEDDLSRNATYSLSLSDQPIKCFLKIKSEMRLAGLPFFIEAFKYFDKKF